jgi:hypothetical protein
VNHQARRRAFTGFIWVSLVGILSLPVFFSDGHGRRVFYLAVLVCAATAAVLMAFVWWASGGEITIGRREMQVSEFTDAAARFTEAAQKLGEASAKRLEGAGL